MSEHTKLKCSPCLDCGGEMKETETGGWACENSACYCEVDVNALLHHNRNAAKLQQHTVLQAENKRMREALECAEEMFSRSSTSKDYDIESMFWSLELIVRNALHPPTTPDEPTGEAKSTP